MPKKYVSMKRHFIINSASGKGTTTKDFAELREFFTRKIGAFPYSIPKNREDTISITRHLLREGVDQIIVVGGDGTINSVVNGFFEDQKMIRPEACLAISKAGTAGDYYKSIFYEKPHVDWKDVVLEYDVTPVDIGKISYHDPEYESSYFVNMSGIGIVAEIVIRKNRLPVWIPSTLKYVVPALRTIFDYQPAEVNIQLDDKEIQAKIIAISAANGLFAGGGMKFGGHVTLTDGMFDITVIESMKHMEMLMRFSALYKGTLDQVKGVTKYKSSRLSISSPQKLKAEFDGEVYGTTDIDISIESKTLNVCLPK